MNALKAGIGILFIFIVNLHAEAQDFINLNFESTTLSPGGQPSTTSTNIGIPGWTVEIGGSPQSTILYNNGTLGASSAALLAGGQYSPNPVIDGNFSAMLVAGSGGEVSLAQSGLIPDDVNFLTFEAYSTTSGQGEGYNFTVDIDGQALPFFSLTSYGNDILYGADISGYASEFASLEFNALSFFPQNGSVNVLVLDDIQFETSSIPEPGEFGLMGLGGGLVVLWRWCKRRPI